MTDFIPINVQSFLPATKLNWLYFDINSYFATIEQQVDPSLRYKPVVVVPLISDSTCAIAASHEAKLKGIKTGTKIYEAKRLCPELICVQAKHELYVTYHHKILDEINKYLYVDHVFSIDEGAAKLTGDQCEESNALKIALQIKQGIRTNVGEYITCSLGIAPNRFLAKIATNMKKPDGLIVIKPEDIPQKLFFLRLKDIPGVGKGVLQRLDEYGIDSVEKLYKQDARSLKTIWGSITGEKCWYLLRGADLPIIESKKSTIGHSQVIAPNLRNVTSSREIALMLLLRAATRLRTTKLNASSVELNIVTTDTAIFKSRLKITPSSDSNTLSKALLSCWSKLIEENKIKGVKKISINLNGLKPESQQLTFNDFQANNTKQKRQKVSDSLDRLNKKYNKNIISLGLLPKGNRKQNVVAFGYIPE